MLQEAIEVGIERVTNRFFVSAVLFFGFLPACNNCEALEEEICEDLGAADCKLWKQAGGPDSLAQGRRAWRACFNARFSPGQYDPYLTGAKAVVEAAKKSGAGKAR